MALNIQRIGCWGQNIRDGQDKCKKVDIVLSGPDKSEGKILNKSGHVEKMQTSLNNESKCAKTIEKSDKAHQIEKPLPNIPRRLEQINMIDSINFEQVRPTGTTNQKIYGLHKTQGWSSFDIYFRRITVAVKWLAGLVEPVRRKTVRQ